MSEPCPLPHVPQRARDYVLERLPEAEQTAFEDHLAGCPECARRVTELEASLLRLERDVADATGLRATPWERLGRTVLAPGPALAYLVVLLLAYPILELARPPRQTAPEVQASARSRGIVVRSSARLVGEPVLRGERLSGSGPAEFPPAEITLEPHREMPLLLELDTGLDPADLDGSGVFQVEVHAGDERVLSEQLGPQDLGRDGSLRLLLPRQVLSSGRTYLVRVVAADPAGTEELLFRRSFLLLIR